MKRPDIIDEMRAARDRVRYRLDVMEHEMNAARRDMEDWNQRIGLAERRRKRRKATRRRRS